MQQAGLVDFIPVKRGSIIVALLMVGVLSGTPLVACPLPGMAATEYQATCCQDMGHNCDHGGMSPWHSCCQTVSPPEQASLTASSFTFFVSLMHTGSADPGSASAALRAFSTAMSVGYSPPQAHVAATEILRI